MSEKLLDRLTALETNLRVCLDLLLEPKAKDGEGRKKQREGAHASALIILDALVSAAEAAERYAMTYDAAIAMTADMAPEEPQK
jgi:hypothetical protein